jgi:hypothetical protein
MAPARVESARTYYLLVGADETATVTLNVSVQSAAADADDELEPNDLPAQATSVEAGAYEDIDGDVDIFDVQALFKSIDD